MSQKEELLEGYEIPIHRSLVKPLYWMGVPRNLFITEILFAVLGGIFMKTWTVLFVAVAAHYLFRHLGQQDPQFHQVFWQGKSHKSYYYR